MDQDTKAKFILALHKHSLQAFDAGGAVSGGLSGAATGAALGTVVPVIGTAVGAIAGGAIGALSGSGALSGGDPAQQANVINPVTQYRLNQGDSNIQGSYAAQQQLANQLAAQNGVQNQNSVYNAYGQIANGQGPNVAQNALNQATGQNVANQASLMASQRGAGANVGLLARQAAQQGAATQQQAVGQAATLQAQQQQAALAAQAGIAQNQIGNLSSANQVLGSEALTNQAQQYGAIANVNSSNVGSQSNVNSNTSSQNINSQNLAGQAIGGIASGVSSGTLLGPKQGSTATPAGSVPSSDALTLPALGSSSGFKFNGGLIQKMASGGMAGEPQSFAGKWLNGPSLRMDLGGGIDPQMAAQGGKVDADTPAQKAVKKGNSLSNDKVPEMLSEGEIVIPRSITTHPKAPEKAAEFVQAVLNRRKMGKKL